MLIFEDESLPVAVRIEWSGFFMKVIDLMGVKGQTRANLRILEER